MAARVFLQCGECGTLLKSAETAQQHAKDTFHTNFRESDEAFLYLDCTVCGKRCVCKTESLIHARKSGHTEFVDRTAELVEEASKRAREDIRQMLQTALNRLNEGGTSQAERRGQQLGLPSKSVLEEGQSSLPLAARAERMGECLQNIQQNHLGDAAKVKTAFNTLLMYARNVAMNPDEERYRKIRVSNVAFQERVAKLQGGIEFLELCGFKKISGGEFLYMPREDVDIGVLHSAGNELKNALGNP